MPKPKLAPVDREALTLLSRTARRHRLNVEGGLVRRSSSRFCFGVEHGDYNGTELFGVGTDRFIWMAYRPNGTDRVRLFSENFPGDGVVDFKLGSVPPPRSARIADSWARFPMGAAHVLRREGFALKQGFDAVLYGNIPGGGMSRSASLTVNLVLTMLEVNGLEPNSPLQVVDIAQAVENDYIGSPCGQLDQIMILFARAGQGTHYNPADRSIRYVPLGAKAPDFRIVSLDTGTVRPGLEKSTYKVRRAECEELAALAGPKFKIRALADVRTAALRDRILKAFGSTHPGHCDRLRYIYDAQERFYRLLKAWQAGRVAEVGALFRADGIGLRDWYCISGPELETMCDIVRTVPGVLGERMLGGGDKGAAGALVLAEAVPAVRAAVGAAYPRSRPDFADKYSVHECRIVDGIATFPFSI